MFCKKLVLIAATAALALGSISAKEQSKIHVRVHASNKAVCSGAGQSPMSVEGVEGVYCVTGQACVANINGSCPGPQTGLPNGAVCGTVKTGVYGCKPAPAAPVCTGNDVTPMSVEGVEGIFCVNGKACAGQDGACPGPQAGLPNGAVCGTVKTGVLGCKPKTAKHHKHHKSHVKNVCSGAGQSPMSVEGVPGVYCVTGQACVADISTGSCPGPQEGLPNGAHCGKVITGVYGCKPNADAPKTEAPKTEAPKTDAPKTVSPVVTSAPKIHAPKPHTPKTPSPSDNHGVVIVDIDVDVNGEDSDDSEDNSSDVVILTDSDDSEDDSSDSSDDRRL